MNSRVATQTAPACSHIGKRVTLQDLETYNDRYEPENPTPALGLGKITTGYSSSVQSLQKRFRQHPPKGPKVGPTSGPITQDAIANPRFSNGIISAIVPAPSVMGQDAAIPAKRRNTIRALRLLASAQAMLKIRKMELQTL